MRDLGPLRRRLAEVHQHLAELREAQEIVDHHPDATPELQFQIRTDLAEAHAIAAELEGALLILTTLRPRPSGSSGA